MKTIRIYSSNFNTPDCGRDFFTATGEPVRSSVVCDELGVRSVRLDVEGYLRTFGKLHADEDILCFGLIGVDLNGEAFNDPPVLTND